MLDFQHILAPTGASDVQIFYGTSTAEGGDWLTWIKPRGKTMIDILLVGKGANGGSGVIGANSTAAGGGGGGSGGQTRLTMPLALLPDVLYLSLMGIVTGSQLRSFITLSPRLAAGPGVPIVNDTLMMAYGGTIGGNAAGATAGSAGIAGAIATVGLMPLGWYYSVAIAGQAGIIGGTTVSAANLTLPVTGLLVTGGTGGGGLPATATAGTVGGSFTVAGMFAAHNAPAATAVATTPPGIAAGGYYPVPKLLYGYGGLGSGSTHGSASGGGLVQTAGGCGAPGCGAGGMGGALTGSSAAVIANGGFSFAVFTCW